MRPGGEVRRYVGNFSDYLDKRPPEERPERAAKPEKTEKPVKPAQKPQKLKFSFNEQREYERIDDELAALEEQLAACAREIAAAGNDYVRLQELLAEQERLTRAQEEKTERWVYLNDLAERIQAQK